jgi:two-component sensor histidine kinase
MSLMYRDDGIGLPAGLNLENSQSLGFQLVRLLTVHDLHGNVELKNGHKKGVKFLIKFPTSAMNSGQLDLD